MLLPGHCLPRQSDDMRWGAVAFCCTVASQLGLGSQRWCCACSAVAASALLLGQVR